MKKPRHTKGSLRVLRKGISQARSILRLQQDYLALTIGCSRAHFRAVFAGRRRSSRIEADPRFIGLRAEIAPCQRKIAFLSRRLELLEAQV